MKKLLLSMLGVLIALPAMARDFKYPYEGQTLTYTVLDENAKTCAVKGLFDIDGNDGISEDLVLPSDVYDGNTKYTLTVIGENAFSGCSSLTSVTIPNSVTTIDWWAFSGCSSLKYEKNQKS